jgi:hypothetical protein
MTTLQKILKIQLKVLYDDIAKNPDNPTKGAV